MLISDGGYFIKGKIKIAKDIVQKDVFFAKFNSNDDLEYWLKAASE